MSRLFDRKVEVTIGVPGGDGRRFVDLHVVGSVERDDGKKPNKGKVQIYNPSPDTVGLAQRDGAVVVVSAGYEQPSVIFTGDIDDAKVTRGANFLMLEIEARDGLRAFQQSQVFETFNPPLSTRTLLTRIANAMGLGFGNFPEDLPEFNYEQGYTLAGPARDALDEICQSIGALWSIQDGELVITEYGKGVTESVYLLSPGTGLIGSPERTKDGVKAVSLLNGAIKPRRLVAIKSAEVSGFYLPKKVTHSFDSRGQEFFTTVEKATEVTADG